MAFADVLARFLSPTDETVQSAPVDLSSSPDVRRALLERSRAGALASPAPGIPVDPHFDDESDALAFARTMARRHGLDLGWDDASLAAVDGVLDGMRARRERFDPLNRRYAAAWLAEWSRHARGLTRDAGGIVTDGRVAYDPDRRIQDRLVSGDAPSLAASMDLALTAMETRTLAAA